MIGFENKVIVCVIQSIILLMINKGFGQSILPCELIKTDSMEYIRYWHGKPINDQKAEIKSYGKYHIEMRVEETLNNCDWKITIRNWADKPFLLFSEEEKLSIICEAKNTLGIWKPIEYKPLLWCLTGSYDFKLKPTEYIEVYRAKYIGDFKTKIRFKFKVGGFVFYSNSIKGRINKKQVTIQHACVLVN